MINIVYFMDSAEDWAEFGNITGEIYTTAPSKEVHKAFKLAMDTTEKNVTNYNGVIIEKVCKELKRKHYITGVDDVIDLRIR